MTRYIYFYVSCFQEMDKRLEDQIQQKLSSSNMTTWIKSGILSRFTKMKKVRKIIGKLNIHSSEFSPNEQYSWETLLTWSSYFLTNWQRSEKKSQVKDNTRCSPQLVLCSSFLKIWKTLFFNPLNVGEGIWWVLAGGKKKKPVNRRE